LRQSPTRASSHSHLLSHLSLPEEYALVVVDEWRAFTTYPLDEFVHVWLLILILAMPVYHEHLEAVSVS
jgi:hypothetical protein